MCSIVGNLNYFFLFFVVGFRKYPERRSWEMMAMLCLCWDVGICENWKDVELNDSLKYILVFLCKDAVILLSSL